MIKLKRRIVTLTLVALFTLCVCGSTFATSAQWQTFPLQSISGYTTYTYGIQAILYRFDSNTNTYCSGIDGIYGSGTKQAVMLYQEAKGLTADGVVGANTWKSLYNSLTATNVDQNIYQNFRVTRGFNSSNAIASRYETDGNNIATHWYAHGASTSYIYFGTYA